METPAGTLFDAINSEDDIDRLIASQVEDLYLDFKFGIRKRRRGTHRTRCRCPSRQNSREETDNPIG